MDLSGDFLLVGEDMGCRQRALTAAPVGSGGENVYAVLPPVELSPTSSPWTPGGKHPAQPQYCVVCFDREPSRAEVVPVRLIQPVCCVCYQRRLYYCSQTCLLSEAPQAVRRCHHCAQRYPRVNILSTVVVPREHAAGACCSLCDCNWLQRRMSRKLSGLKCAFCKTAGS